MIMWHVKYPKSACLAWMFWAKEKFLIQVCIVRAQVPLSGRHERKYEAAAVTVDISRFPDKNCLVRQAQMREREIGTRLFCEGDESISNSSHSEEESIEILNEKPLRDVGRKIREGNLL
ncbi:hypothetical protein TNCV_2278841 [Trichonephila clavipes]|uniref:Uncharacterized protein n=1 Tax=Trichonephila clavipes TaxID=2585209 RepID=A0A8X6RAY4_TRICX|nr:hypothetical protein TNCV_2278841 [Trichonephila clavipes]